MHQYYAWIIAAGLLLAGSGCVSHSPRTAGEGQAVFTSMQKAVAAAGKQAEPSLALVKVERGASRTGSGRSSSSGSASDSSTLCGLAVTAKGHILVPSVIKPDDDGRVTVLVGESEYVARVLKADDSLGMTILKLDSDDTFVPLDLSHGVDLAMGEWAVLLRPTDEDADYQKLAAPVVCQGEMAGRYRRFLLNQAASASGALVVNLSGQVVGLADRNTVMAMTDLGDELKRFVAEATGLTSAEDEQKKKGWFGAMLEPINKDYAKARKLPASALYVMHAGKDSPAAAAGLRDGDLIVGVNGQPLRFSGTRSQDYFLKSLHLRAGEKFALSVLRQNKPLELSGTITKRPEPETLRAEDLGVTVSGITDNVAFTYNLASTQGVVVTEVQRGSPAATSGTLRQTLISRADVITELAGQPTPTIDAFSRVLETIRRDHPPVVLVKYYRGPLTGYAGLNLAIGMKDNGNKQ